MSTSPRHPKIYHITHVDNLAAIAVEGWLVSDRLMIKKGGPVRRIGMSEIKLRRVNALDVPCHPSTRVGDYVPFYFCPRSIMLYVIHRANNPKLTYRGGQDPIVHLEADLRTVVDWASQNRIRWAFSLSNAGAAYTEFRDRLHGLAALNWDAIRATDFSTPEVKEHKQAEFLLHERFPFDLVERIGVLSSGVRVAAREALKEARYRPPVEIRPEWYF